jgi:hypothetical protein
MRSWIKPSLLLASSVALGIGAINLFEIAPLHAQQPDKPQPSASPEPKKDPEGGIPDRPRIRPKPIKKLNPYTPSREPKGGITGIITVNPVCSIVTVDPTCTTKLYEGRLVIRRQSDGRIFRTTTGADGRYTLNLDPGVYTIAPETISTSAAFSSQTVRIFKNRTSVVDITFQGNTQ